MQIELPKEIEKKIRERVRESKEFRTINEYVEFILAQVVERLEAEKEDKEMKQRLKDLGYID